MIDPAGGNLSEITNETLSEQLMSYLKRSVNDVDQGTLKDWVPDSFAQTVPIAVSHRNRTTKKIQDIISGQEKAILRYLKSLIEGFLLPSDQKNYVLTSPLTGRDSIPFPIHSLPESNECLTQFIREKRNHYQESFEALVADLRSNPDYRQMWHVGDRDIAQMEPEVYQTGPVDMILPVWRSYNEAPRTYGEPAWNRSAKREKVFSVMADPMRRAVRRGSALDLNENREIAFERTSDELTARKNRLLTEVREKRAELTQELVDGLARFNAAAPGLQEEGQQAVSKALYNRCCVICSEIASLEAEIRYVLRYESLHQMQAMSPLAKLIVLVQKSGRDKKIPVKTMGELRDHIEFLIENLRDYFKEATKDLLLRANVVNVIGESVVLEDADKLVLGFQMAEHVENALKELLNRLQAMNFAEVRRTAVKNELRTILKKLSSMQVEFSGAAVRDENANKAAQDEIGTLLSQEEGQKKGRKETLVELAPGGEGLDPDEIMNFSQLFDLYHKTGVTSAYLQGRYGEGSSDKSKLLHFAIDTERSVRHLLNEGACVDFRVGAVQTLARAYNTLQIRQERTAEQGQSWRVFALLSGAKQLFESQGHPHWLSEQVNRVLENVRSVTQVSALRYYEDRDGELVKTLLRRLILSLYLGEASKETIENSPIFEKLVEIWAYLGIAIKTPQMLPGESGGGDLEKLRAVILNATLAMFATPQYAAAKNARDHILYSTPVERRLPVADCLAYAQEIDRVAVLQAVQRVLQPQIRRLLGNEVVPPDLLNRMIALVQAISIPLPHLAIGDAVAPAAQQQNNGGDQQGRRQGENMEGHDVIAEEPAFAAPGAVPAAARAAANGIFAAAHASSDSETETESSSDTEDEAGKLGQNKNQAQNNHS